MSRYLKAFRIWRIWVTITLVICSGPVTSSYAQEERIAVAILDLEAEGISVFGLRILSGYVREEFVKVDTFLGSCEHYLKCMRLLFQ